MPKTHTVDQYNACLPTRLRELLRDRKITQSKLSSDVGILNQSISQYLDGSVTPPLEKLIRLADYFNVSIDYLLGRTEVASTSIKKKEICKTTGLTAKSVDILKKLQFDPKSETSMPNVLSVINTCIGAANSKEIKAFSYVIGEKRWRLIDGVKSRIEYDINLDGSYWTEIGNARTVVNEEYYTRLYLGRAEAKRYACHRIAQVIEEALIKKYVKSDEEFEDGEEFTGEDKIKEHEDFHQYLMEHLIGYSE